MKKEKLIEELQKLPDGVEVVVFDWRKYIKDLRNSYLALSIGMPTSEIPKEILETKRLIITLKRELKNQQH